MSDVAIRVRGLGKSYRLRHGAESRAAYGTLRDDLLKMPKRLWASLTVQQKEYEFRALRDVSFELRCGEVLGVIGRNGAGKSTLLKILSRIAAPSEGEVDIYGRVGSLLEVGTGFHPELTGRENVFLSGAILGMRRQEVRQRFDEIVAFAGVERFVDQPVKHYSSGMSARLGFAVAAHLNPSILIVDEILAVGDAVFQERCIGRMKQASKGEGRTVIIVSHNIGMVQSLCTRGLFLCEGRVAHDGAVKDVVDAYVSSGRADDSGVIDCGNSMLVQRTGGGRARFLGVESRDSLGVLGNRFAFGENFEFRVLINVVDRLPNFILGFSINTRDGQVVVCSNHYDTLPETPIDPGNHAFRVVVRGLYLAPGTYSMTWAITAGNQSESHDYISDCGLLHVEERILPGDSLKPRFDLRPGAIRMPLPWRKE